MSPETELGEVLYEEAIFIEVPSMVVQEETIEYMELDPLELNNCDKGVVDNSVVNCNRPTTDGDIQVVKEPPKKLDCLDNAPSDLLWLLSFRLDKLLSSLSATADSKDDTYDVTGSNKEESTTKRSRKDKVEDIAENTEDGDEGQSIKTKERKPPFTYTELIECALCERGPLTVAELYRWISDTFPYYKANDDRWKNSVRHNLSINPVFRKGTKSPRGAGHLWTVTSPSKPNLNGETPLTRLKTWKRQRSLDKEQQKRDELEKTRKRLKEAELEAIDEAARAVASISDSDGDDVTLGLHAHDSLSRTACDILSGVKKEVAVEFIHHDDERTSADDFLNPVPKEVVVDECGFLYSHIELNLTAADRAFIEQFPDTTSVDHFLDEYSSAFSTQLSIAPLAN